MIDTNKQLGKCVCMYGMHVWLTYI